MTRKKFLKLLREQREVQVLISLVVLLFIVFLGIFPDIKNSNLYSLFGVLSFFFFTYFFSDLCSRNYNYCDEGINLYFFIDGHTSSFSYGTIPIY